MNECEISDGGHGDNRGIDASGSVSGGYEISGKKGWKKSTQNRGEEIKLADEYAEWAEKRKYPKDRRGRLMKINDRARIRFLRGNEQERKSAYMSRRQTEHLFLM